MRFGTALALLLGLSGCVSSRGDGDTNTPQQPTRRWSRRTRLGAQQDLCTVGAQIVMRDMSKILSIYENYAQGFANCTAPRDRSSS